jgi:hypothetical protein
MGDESRLHLCFDDRIAFASAAFFWGLLKRHARVGAFGRLELSRGYFTRIKIRSPPVFQPGSACAKCERTQTTTLSKTTLGSVRVSYFPAMLCQWCMTAQLR